MRQIDNITFACVTLHNMQHSFDCRDEWEAVDFEWNDADTPFVDEEDPLWRRPKVRRSNGEWELVRPGEDHSTVGAFFFGEHQAPVVGRPSVYVDPAALVELHTETDEGFRRRREKLVTNFSIRYAERSIVWLRSSGRQRRAEER
jgi:hypothetical protein